MKLYWLAPVLVLLMARPVHAAEPVLESSHETQVRSRHWYGWQTLVVDAASLGVATTIGGLSDGNNGGRDVRVFATGLGVTGYLLGGPVVHAAHEQWGKAAASLGLRVGAPWAGGLAGFAIASAACPHDDSDVPCSAVGGGLGLLAGVATAIALDSAVLAYEPVPEAQAAQGVRFAPIIIAERNRWGAGLAGTF